MIITSFQIVLKEENIIHTVFIVWYFVGNKEKNRISKQVLQENKAHRIFRKMKSSYPQIHTRRCAYHGLRNIRFLENLVCFVFLKHPFWELLFALLLEIYALGDWPYLQEIYPGIGLQQNRSMT